MFVDLDPDDPALGPLAGRGLDVRERLQALSHIGTGGRLIRTHGDYHLGQTMLTDRGWVILDFEGEPARPLPERRRKRSPLRDVAGMLRSFAYAASAAEQQHGTPAPAGWEERVREAFLEGYFETVDSCLLPAGPGGGRQAAVGLRAREGGLRAALRAQQPARLGRHPGRRHRAAARRGRAGRVGVGRGDPPMPARARPGTVSARWLPEPRIRWHLTAAHTDGRLLRAELWVPPGTAARPPHSHPREEERLELLSGDDGARGRRRAQHPRLRSRGGRDRARHAAQLAQCGHGCPPLHVRSGADRLEHRT